MKVQSGKSTNITNAKKKLTKEEIQARIKSKFGGKAAPKKAPKKVEDKVELKGASKQETEESYGDIKTNDPSSQVTHDKLREILKSGAFQFNEKERKTLSKILK